jgi:hypothetical protein
VKRANRRSTRLPHRLKRSGDVPEPDGPVLIDGSASSGGATRDGVDEVGGVVVRGANSPWGRPRGPMEILAVLRWSSQRGAALGGARSEVAAPVAWQQPQAELAAGQQLKPHGNGAAVASGGARDGSLATWWSSEQQLLAEEARGGAVEGSTQPML